MNDHSQASAAATSTTHASTAATNVRVSENDLHRLQEELNRATAKVATCTGAAIRKEAEHLEAAQSLKVATRNADNLRTQLSEATRRYHAQRATDLGISDPDYLPGSGKVTAAERVTAQLQSDRVLDQGRFPVGSSVMLKSGGPVMKVEHINNGDYRICTWEGMEPDSDDTFHVDMLIAVGGPVSRGVLGLVGERGGESIVPAPKPLRNFDDLTSEEQDAVELISATTNPRWKLPTGELINSNNADVVE